MKAQHQAEFESVLQSILSQSDEDLLRTFEASGSGVYGNCMRSLFGGNSITIQIPPARSRVDIGAADFAKIRHLITESDFQVGEQYALAA